MRRIALLTLISCGHDARLTQASTNVYARSDTDKTTIVSPTVRVAGALDDATLETTYTVDAWTGASVDVVTAATGKITEQRHEVDAALSYKASVVTASANYRFSTENDYVSHGITLGAKAELAGKNTTVGLDGLATSDKVGRAGDPGFSEPQRSLGVRFVLAQILDRNTIAELGWQTTLVDGYQSSPYRFVAIGDTGTCDSLAPFCIPEEVPDRRTRNALTLRLRRALGHDFSTGLDYRFYFDNWGIMGHALQPDLAWRLSDTQLLSLRYRYATQSEAFFYRPRYFDVMSTDGFVTRDRKLSAIVANEVGLQYQHRIESDESDRVITWGLRSTLSRADYLAFVGLDHVWAVELTALVGIEF
jgi:hypothetical protein